MEKFNSVKWNISTCIPPFGYLHLFDCTLTGNRQLSENELRYEGIELRQSEESNDTLHIDHLQMKHSTAFTCRVDNTLTSGEETFLLKVRGRCDNYFYFRPPLNTQTDKPTV